MRIESEQVSLDSSNNNNEQIPLDTNDSELINSEGFSFDEECDELRNDSTIDRDETIPA